jgi:hypothetical protein
LPSIQQKRYEEFASIVEKAAKSTFLGPSQRSCKFRVQTSDGHQHDLYLSGVDLDGELLIPIDRAKSPVLAISQVQAVWHARPRKARVAALCVGVTVAGAFATMLVGTSVKALGGFDGLIVGAIAGAVAAALLFYFLQDSKVMHNWVLVYGAPAA